MPREIASRLILFTALLLLPMGASAATCKELLAGKAYEVLLDGKEDIYIAWGTSDLSVPKDKWVKCKNLKKRVNYSLYQCGNIKIETVVEREYVIDKKNVSFRLLPIAADERRYDCRKLKGGGGSLYADVQAIIKSVRVDGSDYEAVLIRTFLTGYKHHIPQF